MAELENDWVKKALDSEPMKCIVRSWGAVRNADFATPEKHSVFFEQDHEFFQSNPNRRCRIRRADDKEFVQTTDRERIAMIPARYVIVLNLAEGHYISMPLWFGFPFWNDSETDEGVFKIAFEAYMRGGYHPKSFYPYLIEGLYRNNGGK